MNPGPVLSAGTTVKVVDAVPMPSMRGAILGWFRPLIIGFTTSQIQEDGTNKPFFRELQTSGVLQPRGEKLDRQSGGGRSWQHWELHCLPNLVVNTNDRIRIKNTWYTVMEKADYTANGFVRYDLTESPQPYGFAP